MPLPGWWEVGWTLFTLTVCQGVLCNDTAAVLGAQEGVKAAESTGNPTARAMAYFALGDVLKIRNPSGP
ncbi:hypothetical protein F0Q45_18790 [Mycobacterium simiae]|uniref:Uncharacterized protein n=1 Tax=Mycobacterium simiae TaxID=1784 RepID=A0A5B1BJB6_MYCSI|nr:hypothetical protein [Mycobacterium simiae]KAA1248767.1 hypothetical protein F0Q45_18790 [Mycobacterium simiae]